MTQITQNFLEGESPTLTNVTDAALLYDIFV